MAALGFRDRLVVVLAALVAVASVLPWWGLSVIDGHGVPGVETQSAWQGPAQWGRAVIMAVATTAGWLLCRVLIGRVPDVVRAGAGAVIATAAVVTVQGLAIAVRLPVEVRYSYLIPRYEPYLGPGDGSPARSGDAPFGVTLPSLTVPAGAGWGLWLGLAAMLALCWCVLTANPDDQRGPSTNTGQILPPR